MRPNGHNYYVYILTNWDGKRMYVGMTNDLEHRMYEHKSHSVPGFTQKYNIDRLVHFEHCFDVNAAIVREKEIKAWRREKKNKLVQSANPEWRDLAEDWFH